MKGGAARRDRRFVFVLSSDADLRTFCFIDEQPHMRHGHRETHTGAVSDADLSH